MPPVDIVGSPSLLDIGVSPHKSQLTCSVTTLLVKLVDAMMRATLEQFISIFLIKYIIHDQSANGDGRFRSSLVPPVQQEKPERAPGRLRLGRHFILHC